MKSVRVFHPNDEIPATSQLSIMMRTKHRSLILGWRHKGTFWHNRPGYGKIAIPNHEVISFFLTEEVLELMDI